MFSRGTMSQYADRTRDLGEALLNRGPGQRVPESDRLFYGEALRGAAFVIARWLESPEQDDLLPGSLRGALAEAFSTDDTETVVEVVEALAWYHLTEAASYAAAIDEKRLLDSAFPALGWTREPTQEEEFIVRTILQSALVEDPELRWGSFFVAMCELTNVPDEDIDRWILEGVHDDLMMTVLDMWDEFEGRLIRAGMMEDGESTRGMRLVGLSWID